MATPFAGDDVVGAACPVVERAKRERDGSARAAAAGGRRRSVYLSEYAPLWGRAATCGRREAMEDACAAVPVFGDVPVRMLASARELDALALGRVGGDGATAMQLFGVYDGHGGSQVADYCRDRIHVVLREALSRAAAARGLQLQVQGESRELGIQELWEKAFCECFERVDDEVSGEASRPTLTGDGGGAISDPVAVAVAAEDVGSTAVVALVCSSHVIVANCGDSRAVLCSGKKPVPLSVDHKPDRKDERERIEAAGGEVLDWFGHRVAGVLAMSRAIGDRYLKPFVIPKPEVRVVPRAKDDDCLILASDGLWDVISNEEACRAARLQIILWHKKNDATYFGEGEGGGGEPTISDPASQAAAGYLVKLALLKGSMDNITVIVIDLKQQKMVTDTPLILSMEKSKEKDF